MKILLANKFLYPNGGSETYMFDIGRTLVEMGHEVQYFGMEHENRIVGNKAGVYTQNMSFRSGSSLAKLTYPFKIIYSMDSRKKLRCVLEDFCPDVVHLNNINFQITPSVIDEIKEYNKNIRIIYTAHDAQWVCPNHMMRIPSTGVLCQKCINGEYWNCAKNRCIHNSRMQSVLGSFEAEFYKIKETYKKVDVVISPSEFLKRVLSHNEQLDGKITVLHNPIEAKKTEISDEEKNEILNDLGLTEKGYVLYFGRFDSEKGIDMLLSACEKLENIPFVFAGKGECEDRIEALNNNRNIGFRTGKELLSVIKGALFTIVPSIWYENCPYSVIESQLLGTPVLASDIGGIPELILTDNVCDTPTGELFLYNSLEQLINCIENLWNDREKCQKMALNCKALINGELSIKFQCVEDYCKDLLKLYCGNEKQK